MSTKTSKRILIIVISIALITAIIIGVLLLFVLKKETTLKDTYVDVSTKDSNTFYIESYLMMDCCDEWNDFVAYINTLNTTAAEGYEYYICDHSGERFEDSFYKNKITIHPSDEFKEEIQKLGSNGKYRLYSFDKKEEIECEEVNGEVEAKTDIRGIFIVTYTVDDKALEFISNEEECTGQCQECSGSGTVHR